MKRKIKKLLRFIIVFLSCFLLVCFSFPYHVLALEYDGNIFSYGDPYDDNDDLIITWAASKIEALGYDLSGDVSHFDVSVLNLFKNYGVDLTNASGVIDYDGTHNIQGAVIDYSDEDIQDLLSRVGDFENHSEDLELINNFQNVFLPGLDDTWDKLFFTDLFPSADDAELQNISEGAQRNLKKYFGYKYYGALRGNRGDIPSVAVTSDNWANAQDIFVNYFRPEVFAAYNDPTTGGYLSLNGYSNDFYLGNGTYDYSVSPYDIWGIAGNGSYINGTFDLNCTVNGGFNIDSSLTRFNIRLDNLYNKTEIAIFCPDLVNIVPLYNCTVRDGCIITPEDIHNSAVNFYVYVSSVDTSVKIYTENFYSGGVTAPESPIYETPDPSSPTYENDNRIYNYVTTQTDAIDDSYDVTQLYNDILKDVKYSTWLTYPIECYTEFADVLLDNYDPDLLIKINEIDLSFVAPGLKFPHTSFLFSPREDLEPGAYYLFETMTYFIAFGYFWALIMWGRSLILRIGSETIHRDYEG